jgi:hypothetical protein
MSDTAPEAGFPADEIQAQIEAAVERALAARDKQHEEAMEALRRDIAGTVVTFVPSHAGGPNTEIRPTWSLREQEALRAEMLKLA